MNKDIYIEKIINKYKDLNLVVSKDNKITHIEFINNNGDNLYIDFDDEIIISFSKWHIHYLCEDEADLETALEKVDNIINNKEAILLIYSNDKLLGSASSLNKDNYTKEEIVELLKEFFGSSYKQISEELTINLTFFNKKLNKIIII